MKEMKKNNFYTVILVSLTALMAVFLLPSKVLAHPGRTASDGCHYCRTNCSSWGYTYGTRHCHGGGYTAPTIPTCPLFSSYNSQSGQCECSYGYVSSGNSCISRDQYCRNQYGSFAQYDILNDSCGCSYGYILVNGQCINDDSYCRQKLGFNSKYNSLRNACECSYGYVLNSSGSRCISKDEACRDQFGIMSRSTYDGQCKCIYGYHFEGNQCVLDEVNLDHGEITYDEESDNDFLMEESLDESSTTVPSYTSTTEPSPTPVVKPSPLSSFSPTPSPIQSSTPVSKPSPEVLGEDTESSSGDGVLAEVTFLGSLGYIFWRAIKQKWPFHAE